MTDLFHFGLLVCSLASIGAGVWMVYPPAMWIVEGVILLAIVWSARRTEKTRHAQADRASHE